MPPPGRTNDMNNTSALKKAKTCHFCLENWKEIDYKDINTIRRFTNSHMKIVPKKRTGTCAWHQRKLAQAIKRARFMALLNYIEG